MLKQHPQEFHDLASVPDVSLLDLVGPGRLLRLRHSGELSKRQNMEKN